MQKRFIALILSAILILGLLSGCGQTAGSSAAQDSVPAPAETAAVPEATEPEPEPEPEPPAADSAEAPQEVSVVEEPTGPAEPEDYTLTEETETLSLWYPAAGAFQNMIDYTQHERLKATEEKTNVHIELQLCTTETATETLNLMVASGDFPDMVQNPNMLTGGLAAAVENEFLLPLNDYYDEYMPHYKAIRESNEAYIKGSQLTGGVLPMAYTFNKEGYGINLGPVIRQDWLEDLGLEKPVTYDDYHDVLTAFKNEKGADAALWIPYTGSVSGYLAAGFGTGSEMLCKDGQVLYGPVTDEFRDFLGLMKQWYSEGLIYTDFATYTASTQYAPDELITHGRTGIFYSTVAMITEFEGKGGFPLAAIPDAVQKEGDKNHVCHNYSLVVGTGCGITTQCENPELAAQWLNFQYTQAGYLLNNYGEENVSYTLDENGEPHFTDLVTSNPDGLPLPIAVEKYACMSGPFVVDYNRMNGGYTDAQKEASSIWSDTSDNAWSVANVPLEAEEMTAYYSALTEISTYSSSQIAKFIMGEADLDADWDAYVDMVGTLGLETMIDVYTQAVERYNAE